MLGYISSKLMLFPDAIRLPVRERHSCICLYHVLTINVFKHFDDMFIIIDVTYKYITLHIDTQHHGKQKQPHSEWDVIINRWVFSDCIHAFIESFIQTYINYFSHDKLLKEVIIIVAIIYQHFNHHAHTVWTNKMCFFILISLMWAQRSIQFIVKFQIYWVILFGINVGGLVVFV